MELEKHMKIPKNVFVKELNQFVGFFLLNLKIAEFLGQDLEKHGQEIKEGAQEISK
jgi:plastocyanin domain-containing protein